MADREERDLRGQVALVERGRGKRYPPALRDRITAWARRETARGQAARDLARRIGVHRGTLAAWLEDDAAPGALVPVEVIEPAFSTPRIVSVVSPTGFRIEGLTLDEAAALLARLR